MIDTFDLWCAFQLKEVTRQWLARVAGAQLLAQLKSAIRQLSVDMLHNQTTSNRILTAPIETIENRQNFKTVNQELSKLLRDIRTVTPCCNRPMSNGTCHSLQ